MSNDSSYPTFHNDDVEILATDTLFKGFFSLVKVKFRHRLFAGGWSEEIERELFERGHAVAMLPYDPVTDQVVMVEQIRVGALGEARPWQLEIVAGMLDKEGEDPIDVAKREAVEEAGLDVTHIQHISGYYPSAGGCSERLELFIGQVKAPTSAGVFGLESEGEDIRVHILTREEAYEMVKNGTIENAASIITIQWLMLNHQQLRAQWAVQG
ncbi:ADP-ribose diphosphatase [Vibrio breoganii]|uniref:ADP-ribose pyrophosphatase n=1 Tax=Vibrio breoganii TaxID=553239 RepID=A0AAN1CR35_9VIBR|nr:ADP-ribose diphosphatase [Vibrio breoganii]ANO32047.1 ADP-ribose diphosphatase [Vibrio breoganii]MDN3716362.1 ADP-ribose diphosphatase [Vibrio breoganii]OED84925.1 ADP-ribose diphosphatase [Vibrio breoganii ZF-55]OED94702.1 ADP-ribose diphosphatase [Vibrio breoganii ZF-29]OEF86347.1 ADP-ribose diphosphatase [Vibrio breoganii 1C10]